VTKFSQSSHIRLRQQKNIKSLLATDISSSIGLKVFCDGNSVIAQVIENSKDMAAVVMQEFRTKCNDVKDCDTRFASTSCPAQCIIAS
jgi:hypothetical protein